MGLYSIWKKLTKGDVTRVKCLFFLSNTIEYDFFPPQLAVDNI